MSKTEKYQPFFTGLLQDLEKERPGVTEFRVQQKSFVKICKAGRSDFYFSCSFSNDGFGVNLTFQAKDEDENRAVFDALEKEKDEIEEAIGFSLEWIRDRTPEAKRSDIRAKRPGQITDSSSQLEDYRAWAVKTIIKFVDVFQPKIRDYLEQSYDPDEGLELRDEIKERLRRSLTATQTGGETRPAQAVAAKFGLEWEDV